MNAAVFSTYGDEEVGVVTALVIDEDELEAEYHAKLMQDVVSAEVIDASELKESGRWWKILCCCLLIVAIVLSIVFTAGDDDNDKAAPTPSPTVQSPSDFLRDLFSPYSGDTLDDPTTPQYLAFQWLLNDDPLQLPIKDTNETILMERYAAAVFYYATNGENWSDSLNFLSDRPICEWKTDLTGMFCLEGTTSPVRLDICKSLCGVCGRIFHAEFPSLSCEYIHS